MFLNVSFENKINNTGKELLCCEYSICTNRIKNTQSYIQRISDISPNNGIHCLDCGIKQIENNKKIALNHLNSVQVILEYARKNLNKDFLSLQTNIENIPKVGDEIYVDTSDEVNGGRTTISDVEIGRSSGRKTVFITTAVNPGTSYNWEYLSKNQDIIKKHYGDRKASRDVGARYGR